MKYLGYVLTILSLRILSKVPACCLYLLSDVFRFLLEYVFAYRKKVIISNLRHSFPDKSTKDIKRISHRFYQNLSDVIIENGVSPFYSKRKLEKLFRFSNIEVLNEYFEKGRDIICVTGHYSNWEWASPLAYSNEHLVLAIYKPLKNKFFDKALIRARSRFNARAVPMASTARTLMECKNNGIKTLTGMVGDQCPLRKHYSYWTKFLNQDTPVFTGSEKLAIKLNAVVVFLKPRRLRRGKYQAEFEVVSENPGETAPNEITEKHTRILEKLILENPSSWLWSHRRWKYSYEEWEKIHVRT